MWMRLSAAVDEMTILTALRTAATSAVAASILRPAMREHGADRQRRPERVPGAGLQGAARRRSACVSMISTAPPANVAPATCPRSASDLQFAAPPRRPSKVPRSLPRPLPTSRTRRPQRQHDRPAFHINAVGRRLPRQDGTAPRYPARSDIFVEYPPLDAYRRKIQQLAPDHAVTELWRVYFR